MKKLVCCVLAMMMLCVCAAAESVYVTISDDQGNLVMASEAIDVSDADEDGAITVYDALYAAHEAAYDGGAAAGFGVENTEYGLSLTKLWGVENGGSYGYYVNNVSAYSPLDPLKEGDHLQAYVYTDLEAWSDTYCYFDCLSIETSADFELTLTAQTFDADWNAVLHPIEGAIITVNGNETEFVTDAEGKVVIDLQESGEYVISAVSDQMTLVPPVCLAKIG